MLIKSKKNVGNQAKNRMKKLFIGNNLASRTYDTYNNILNGNK